MSNLLNSIHDDMEDIIDKLDILRAGVKIETAYKIERVEDLLNDSLRLLDEIKEAL